MSEGRGERGEKGLRKANRARTFLEMSFLSILSTRCLGSDLLRNDRNINGDNIRTNHGSILSAFALRGDRKVNCAVYTRTCRCNHGKAIPFLEKAQ